jgi:hypothetical protein
MIRGRAPQAHDKLVAKLPVTGDQMSHVTELGFLAGALAEHRASGRGRAMRVLAVFVMLALGVAPTATTLTVGAKADALQAYRNVSPSVVYIDAAILISGRPGLIKLPARPRT